MISGSGGKGKTPKVKKKKFKHGDFSNADDMGTETVHSSDSGKDLLRSPHGNEGESMGDMSLVQR